MKVTVVGATELRLRVPWQLNWLGILTSNTEKFLEVSYTGAQCMKSAVEVSYIEVQCMNKTLL